MILLPNYLPFSYQKDSIESTLTILEQVGGCYIMDSTGLGKSVTALTACIQVAKKILVISPLKHKKQWLAYASDASLIGVTLHWASYQQVSDIETFDYEAIIVDEAHNLRNIETKGFESVWTFIRLQNQLPKVILLSATPFQNNHQEFFASLTLIPAKRSTFLYLFMGRYIENIEICNKSLNKLTMFKNETPKAMDKILEGIKLNNNIKALESGIKEHLGEFCIRTTREDIKSLYPSDMEAIGAFPIVTDEQISIDFPEGSKEYKLVRNLLHTLKELPLAMYNPQKYIESETLDMSGSRGIIRTFLLKRLDSSLQALEASLLKMCDKLAKIVLERPAFIEFETFKLSVTEAFLEDCKTDLEGIQELCKLTTAAITESLAVKETALINALKENKGKSIIFTEYKATLKHLEGILEKEGFRFISITAECSDKELETVAEEFDANHHIQTNKFDVLLSTDVLSEGVNLHRASAVIQYDSKWNPQKSLQRKGRIDRISTQKNHLEIKNLVFSTETLIDEIIEFEGKTQIKRNLAEFFLDFNWRDYRKSITASKMEDKTTYLVKGEGNQRIDTYGFNLNTGKVIVINYEARPFLIGETLKGRAKIITETLPEIIEIEKDTRFQPDHSFETIIYQRDVNFNLYLEFLCNRKRHEIKEIGRNDFTKLPLQRLIAPFIKKGMNSIAELEKVPQKFAVIKNVVDKLIEIEEIKFFRLLTDNVYQRNF